jgi:hypothetical protein
MFLPLLGQLPHTVIMHHAGRIDQVRKFIEPQWTCCTCKFCQGVCKYPEVLTGHLTPFKHLISGKGTLSGITLELVARHLDSSSIAPQRASQASVAIQKLVEQLLGGTAQIDRELGEIALVPRDRTARG